MQSDLMPQEVLARFDPRWDIQPLDWSVSFPRSPQHLSNQLRGKRISSQLELFEDIYSGLKPEIQREVREKDISVVGFDLTVNQQRSYEGGLRLLACSNYQSRRVVITPDDWFRAYDLEKRETNRGWKEISGQERHDALAALIELAGMPWLVSYKKQENGRWYLIQRMATLWKVELKSPLGDISVDTGKVTPDRISQIEKIAIEFDDVWFDQREQYYFYKPARLYTRIALTLPGKIKRQPQHLHTFLDWIFAEAGRLRVLHKNQPPEKCLWDIRSPWMDLARQCRMDRQLEHRNYKRVQQALLDSAKIAQDAQIISSYKLDGDDFTVTFDNRIFADLDEYLNERRTKQQRQSTAKSNRAKPQQSALWKDKSRYSLSEINKLIEDHEEALRSIKSRCAYKYSIELSQTVPDFTPEEQEHWDHHQRAIQEFKEIKLGIAPLKRV